MSDLLRITEKGRDWQEFWSVLRRSFPKRAPDPSLIIDHEYYALRLESRMIGTTIAERDGQHIVSYFDVSILPEYRGLGHGRDMLTQLNASLSSRFKVAVLYTDMKTTRFYDSIGFEVERSDRSLAIQEMVRKLG